MIGCRCKRREALSRAVLIGRALLPTMRGSGSERSSWEVRLVALCGPQGTAEPAPEPKNAPSWSATMAGEAHLVPFRTQKLSPRAPMVLRSESVGEQDVADQLGAFSRLWAPRRAGARIVSSRAATGHEPGRRRRTLKTGYCDRKIDERQRIEERSSNFRIHVNSNQANPDQRDLEWASDSYLRKLRRARARRAPNGEFDPGSG